MDLHFVKSGDQPEKDEALRAAIESLDCGDNCTRCEGIEHLRLYGEESVRVRIRAMLLDPWEVVRIEAIEYLEAWNDKDSIPMLLQCLRDEDDVVRRYAACALGNLGAREILPLAENAFAWEGCTDNDRLGYNYALLRLGEEGRFLPFLKGFFSEEYEIRCATANMVTEFLDEEGAPFILALLEVLRKQEDSRAVRSTYEETINYIRENILGGAD